MQTLLLRWGGNISKPVFLLKLNIPWPIQGDAAATTASAPETFISLKKNQALFDTCKNQTEKDTSRNSSQVLDDPLHHAQIIHHLDEGDEKDD